MHLTKTLAKKLQGFFNVKIDFLRKEEASVITELGFIYEMLGGLRPFGFAQGDGVGANCVRPLTDMNKN